MHNNLKKLQEEREAMLPPELEDRVTAHLGTMAYFGNLIELFVPNALQVVVRMIGGDDMPCLQRTQKRPKPAPDWRKRPPIEGGGEPGSNL
ncbi:MAG: hypothetical protein JNJ57_03365 [Saprospiraceae bacterium]|nr:hypothetical protein [Saprospiraceae bacterium]